MSMASVPQKRDSGDLRRLMLELLKKLEGNTRKEFICLYGLSSTLQENHEILTELDSKKLLLMTKDNIEVLIKNLEAVEKPHLRDQVIKFKTEHFATDKDNNSRELFVGQAAEATDLGQISLDLRHAVSPKEEALPNVESCMVTGRSISKVITQLEDYAQPQKKRKLEHSASLTTRECDSTYNSEEEEEEEELPEVATGDDLKYMKQAKDVALKSPDKHTKVGAILVNPDGKVIGKGFNHMPRENLPWDSKAAKEEDTKYPYAVNAILQAYKNKEEPKGSTLYTNIYPASRDGVIILQAEIKEVVFLVENTNWRKRYHTGATKRLFDGEIKCRQVYMPEDSTE